MPSGLSAGEVPGRAHGAATWLRPPSAPRLYLLLAWLSLVPLRPAQARPSQDIPAPSRRPLSGGIRGSCPALCVCVHGLLPHAGTCSVLNSGSLFRLMQPHMCKYHGTNREVAPTWWPVNCEHTASTRHRNTSYERLPVCVPRGYRQHRPLGMWNHIAPYHGRCPGTSDNALLPSRHAPGSLGSHVGTSLTRRSCQSLQTKMLT